MNILDRYIIWLFISRLLWAMAASLLVFIVVDNVENLDKFIDSGVPMQRVLYYYLLYVPYILYLVLPVATLLATLFTIGGMTMNNELTAMHSAGVPFLKPLYLLIVASTLGAVGAFFIGETWLPQSNRIRMEIYRYEVKRIPRETRTNMGRLYFQYGEGKQIYLDRYNPLSREAFGVELVETGNGSLMRRVEVEKLVWRDGLWWLQGGFEKRFQPDGGVLFTRPQEKTLMLPGLRPDQLERVQTAPEELNYRELKEFIQRLKITGSPVQKWEVDRLFKLSLPAAAIIIVLFGAPIAAIRRRGGTALGFGLALFICFIYYGLIQVGKTLGYSGALPPLISAWAGNMLFGALGLVIWARSSN